MTKQDMEVLVLDSVANKQFFNEIEYSGIGSKLGKFLVLPDLTHHSTGVALWLGGEVPLQIVHTKNRLRRFAITPGRALVINP